MQNTALIIALVAIACIIGFERNSVNEAAACLVAMVALFVWVICYVSSGKLWVRKKRIKMRDTHWY